MNFKTLGVDVYDACGVVGFCAVECGVWQWSHPAAWVIGGVWLIVAAVWPDMRKVKR
jgi:hypothetical protein